MPWPVAAAGQAAIANQLDLVSINTGRRRHPLRKNPRLPRALPSRSVSGAVDGTLNKRASDQKRKLVFTRPPNWLNLSPEGVP
jgi:hypothetical protein